MYRLIFKPVNPMIIKAKVKLNRNKTKLLLCCHNQDNTYSYEGPLNEDTIDVMRLTPETVKHEGFYYASIKDGVPYIRQPAPHREW